MFRYIIYFVLFFFLFYAEGIKVGGMTVSQLWKMPLIVVMVFLIVRKRRHHRPLFISLYYWIAIKNLFNAGTIKTFVSNIQEGLRFVFIPLIYDSFNLSNKSVESLYKFLLVVAQYFVLTNIPFIFFGLPSLHEGKEYGDFIAYTGIFQTQHAMSVIMSLCILVILQYFKREGFSIYRFSSLYNGILLVLAVYAMLLGYARTGWLMCLVGIMILFVPKKISGKQILVFTLVLMVLVAGIAYLMENNQKFHDRILGIDAVTGVQRDVDSGRSEYIKHGLDYYMQGSALELLFGRSMVGLRNYEEAMTTMNIATHNGFSNMIVVNGIVGLILMIWCMFAMLIWIRHRKYCYSGRLALAAWFMNFSFQMTQGGHIFHADLFYALIFVILERERRLLARGTNL